MTGKISDPSTPATAGAGFMAAMLLCFCGAVAGLVFGDSLGSSYSGIGMLLAIPFAMGGLAVGSDRLPFGRLGCVFAPITLFAALLSLAYFGMGEGLVCIIMVLPFWIAAGVGGGLAAWLMRRRAAVSSPPEGSARLKVSALLTLPFVLVFAEEASPPDWREQQVSRVIEITAPVEDIWPLLISLANIDPIEGQMTFTHDYLRIPRPTDVRFVKQDDAFIRKAEWGANVRFEERVTALVPGKRIAWNFIFPDDSVQQHTDRHIAPDGPLLRIATGGYVLQRLDGGGARLTLTTNYEMRTRIGWYFEWWGEKMLGDVQSNILAIIKQRAERGSMTAEVT